MVGMLEIIESKKRNQALSESEIRWWVEGVVQASIPEYQSAALLMAIRLNGMSFDETLVLTRAMADSGDRVVFDGYRVVVDKHSTGGVGDKVTLILAPLVAACGVPVAMLSGRALGFTGGTIDKFESLPGVRCQFDGAGMVRMMTAVGWANAQPGSEIAPADRALYALRDVTGTIDSIPLITASIMSKKMCGGATHLCLDVKCGTAAFMDDYGRAEGLAKALKTVGELGGLGVRGVISRMDSPLGATVGNYLELWESVQYLREWKRSDLSLLVLELARTMLEQAGVDAADAESKLHDALDSGRALEKLESYLAFCGARPAALKALLKGELDASTAIDIRAEKGGVVGQIDAHALALVGLDLGAGRRTHDAVIDPLAGFVLDVESGDPVQAGDRLMRVFGGRARSVVSRKRDALNRIVSIVPQANLGPGPILSRF